MNVMPTSSEVQSLLLDTLSCGDPELDKLLKQNISVLWRLRQVRCRADLLYLYVQYDLLMVAMGYSRNMVDTWKTRASSSQAQRYISDSSRVTEAQRTSQTASCLWAESSNYRQWQRDAQSSSRGFSTTVGSTNGNYFTDSESTSERGGNTVSMMYDFDRSVSAFRKDRHSSRYHATNNSTADGTGDVSQTTPGNDTSVHFPAPGDVTGFNACDGGPSTSFSTMDSYSISIPFVGTVHWQIGNGYNDRSVAHGGGGAKVTQGSASGRTNGNSERRGAAFDFNDTTTFTKRDGKGYGENHRSGSQRGEGATSAFTQGAGQSRSGSDQSAHSQGDGSSQQTSQRVSWLKSSGSSTRSSQASTRVDYWSQIFDSYQQMLDMILDQIKLAEKQRVGGSIFRRGCLTDGLDTPCIRVATSIAVRT